MNLLLQAIKSLFRKVEIRLSNSISILTNKINKAQSTANIATNKATTAYDKAESAYNYADDAYSSAYEAKSLANHIYTAYYNKSTGILTAYGQKPKNGDIIVLIPNSTASTTDDSSVQLSIGGLQAFLNAGVHTLHTGQSTSSSNFPLKARDVVRQGVPIIVTYTGYKYIELTTTTHKTPVVVERTIKTDSVPGYFYGCDSSLEYYKYKYMRVKSSTKGSSKLFDITVDDNGTITAVEVT